MTDRIEIPANAQGRIDLFALNLDDADVPAFMIRTEGSDDAAASWPLRAALDADFLAPEGAEAVRLSDLAGVGLPDYLTQGLGARESDVAPMADMLNTLKGFVVILRSTAYGGMAQTLSPKRPLTYIATFTEEQAVPPGPRLQSDSARPQTPLDESAGPEPEVERAGGGSPLPVIAGSLVLAGVLVLVLAMAFGQ